MGWQICPPSMTSENGQKIENNSPEEEEGNSLEEYHKIAT